jgi:hypothetical protein
MRSETFQLNSSSQKILEGTASLRHRLAASPCLSFTITVTSLLPSLLYLWNALSPLSYCLPARSRTRNGPLQSRTHDNSQKRPCPSSAQATSSSEGQAQDSVGESLRQKKGSCLISLRRLRSLHTEVSSDVSVHRLLSMFSSTSLAFSLLFTPPEANHHVDRPDSSTPSS